MKNTTGDMPTKMTTDNNTQMWLLHGELHREDGPAVTRPDGTQEWLLHGERHREGGPAVIRPDGTQVWLLHGEPHREDGPAVTRPDGTQEWWLHGKRRQDAPMTQRYFVDIAKAWPFGYHWTLYSYDPGSRDLAVEVAEGRARRHGDAAAEAEVVARYRLATAITSTKLHER